MKTTTVKTILAILVTLVMVACGNDDDGGAPITNQRVVSSNVKFTSSSGAVTIRDFTLNYNADNMVSAYQYLGGSPSTVKDATITYNLNKKVTESVGRTFEYDANNRIVKIKSSISRFDLETTFFYDDVGRVIIVYGKEFENGVEDEQRRTTATLDYTNGLLTKVTRTRTRRGSSLSSTTDITYDAAGNISRTVYTSFDGKTVRTDNFTYDTNNEIGYNLANTSGWLLNNQGISLIPLYSTYFNRQKLFNQLGQIGMGYASIYLYAKNNVVTREAVTEYENVVDRREVSTYNYTYNSANYPLTVNESYTYEGTGNPTETATYETTYTYEDY